MCREGHVFEAKSFGVLETIRWAQEQQGIQKVVVESDLMLTVQAIRQGTNQLVGGGKSATRKSYVNRCFPGFLCFVY